jgi:hypothetical protein
MVLPSHNDGGIDDLDTRGSLGLHQLLKSMLSKGLALGVFLLHEPIGKADQSPALFDLKGPYAHLG